VVETEDMDSELSEIEEEPIPAKNVLKEEKKEEKIELINSNVSIASSNERVENKLPSKLADLDEDYD
jgi:hypothetical protein